MTDDAPPGAGALEPLMQPIRPSRSIRLAPLAMAALAIAVPLIGSGFTTWGLAAIWAIGVCLAVATLILVRPSRQVRVFAELAALPMLFFLAYEGGWWFIPAVVADLVISAREATEP